MKNSPKLIALIRLKYRSSFKKTITIALINKINKHEVFMQKRKIGLAVVTYKDNFGSALQTYATQYYINRIGFETEIISTELIHNEVEKNKRRYYLKRIFNLSEFFYLFSQAFTRVSKKISKHYKNEAKIRHAQYLTFYKKYLHFSQPVNSYSELSDFSKKYYAIVVGSDQLWRPSNIAGKYFTLEFVPDGVRKIAYSTSFGVAKLHSSIKKHATFFLNKFDFISVRENSGKEIVDELTKKNAKVVCDPTMLLTRKDWDKHLDPVPFVRGDYILVYIMGKSKVHRDFVKRLQYATGLPTVALLHGSVYIPNDEKLFNEMPFDVGPLDFINLIKNARYVCTDSFHCCVFSILNHTNFFVFERDGKSKTTSANDRIYTLLDHVGLSNRVFSGKETIDKALLKNIDFDEADAKIESLRNESIDYLTTALGDNNA